MAKNSVTNTTVATESDPLTFFAEQVLTGRAIENSERRGQQELVVSDVLPAAMSPETRTVLEKAGVIFGELVEGDNIFRNATLPIGWRKEATDHDMHSHLLDDKGRLRANIFYKAAFYDRSARLTAMPRYSMHNDYERLKKDGCGVAYVKRDDVIVFTSEIHPKIVERDGGEAKYYEPLNKAEEQTKAWLKAYKPDWTDKSAYWDEP